MRCIHVPTSCLPGIDLVLFPRLPGRHMIAGSGDNTALLLGRFAKFVEASPKPQPILIWTGMLFVQSCTLGIPLRDIQPPAFGDQDAGVSQWGQRDEADNTNDGNAQLRWLSVRREPGLPDVGGRHDPAFS